MTGAVMRQEMAEQPGVLAALLTRFDAIAASVRPAAPPVLLGTQFVGRGSSDNAAQLGRYLAEIGSGRPAGLGAMSVHTRYHADVDYRGYLVACFSQSGETPEVVTTAGHVRTQGARVVAVCNDPASRLAVQADLAIALEAGPERAVPATKTVTAQLLAATAIAAGLGAPVDAASLSGLGPAVTAALAGATPARLAAGWAGHDALLVLGRGAMTAAAFETALKVRETAGVFAQAMSSADLLHGPIASIRPGTPTVVLRGGAGLDDDITEVVDRLEAVGADVRVWPAAVPGGSLAAEVGSAVAAVVRGQALALAWALAVDRDPDRPAGLQKVTLTT